MQCEGNVYRMSCTLFSEAVSLGQSLEHILLKFLFISISTAWGGLTKPPAAQNYN